MPGPSAAGGSGRPGDEATTGMDPGLGPGPGARRLAPGFISVALRAQRRGAWGARGHSLPLDARLALADLPDDAGGDPVLLQLALDALGVVGADDEDEADPHVE